MARPDEGYRSVECYPHGELGSSHLGLLPDRHVHAGYRANVDDDLASFLRS